MKKSQPVIVVMSILAGLQVLGAGSALADVVSKDVAALFALVVASAQVGMQFYVRSQVTPHEDVILYRDDQGHITEGGEKVGVDETIHLDDQGH